MRFVVLMHGDEAVWRDASTQERAAIIDQHTAFAAQAPQRGCTLVGGEALTDVAVATMVRRHGDHLEVTEGPLAESVEQLGGFYVLEAPDVDAVTEALRELPEHYAFEIRPVLDLD
ncbi:YciI family protein [Actinotalea subterranea]|uniref:YciI family protein n=1 Tax=Actinotalea subterranea TaxID=2607497 RepID=UPI0011EE8737|nr:YciI family protein [Actinotalea subterranea]